MFSLTSLMINELFKEVQNPCSPRIYQQPNGHVCKMMSFNIDLILGVKTAMNGNTQLYELLFEVVLNAPLKYCSIWESDIARKTLMNHKMFADIGHELQTKENIIFLRENIMNGRISKAELSAFRDSRVKQLKEKWTLIAQEIIEKQMIKQRNIKKKKTKHRRRRRSRYIHKKKKKIRKADEVYIYSGGENEKNINKRKYKFRKHKKRHRVKKKSKALSSALLEMMKNIAIKKRKQSENTAVYKNINLVKNLESKTCSTSAKSKKRKLNNSDHSLMEFTQPFPVISLPALNGEQSLDLNMLLRSASLQQQTQSTEQRSQVLNDLEKMLFPVSIKDVPFGSNIRCNRNQRLNDIEHVFHQVASANYSLLNSTLNINNQQISMSLNELEKNLNLNPGGRKINNLFNDGDMKDDEQNVSKISFIDIHMYNNVPSSVTLLRKQNLFTWKREEQEFLSQTENRNVALFPHFPASLVCIQKLISELESEAQMIFDQQLSFEQKLKVCKKQYSQWKLNWASKKAQLKMKLEECENEREKALENMGECKERIRKILEIVKADDAEEMSNETAKDIHCKLEEGMEDIHEIQNVQKNIKSKVEFFHKTDQIFDESLAENSGEYERFCQKMQFVCKYGKRLLMRKQKMLKQSVMLENRYMYIIQHQ